jgi:hypothetical protein
MVESVLFFKDICIVALLLVACIMVISGLAEMNPVRNNKRQDPFIG